MHISCSMLLGYFWENMNYIIKPLLVLAGKRCHTWPYHFVEVLHIDFNNTANMLCRFRYCSSPCCKKSHGAHICKHSHT